MIEKYKNLRFNLTNNMRDLIIEIVIINEILKENNLNTKEIESLNKKRDKSLKLFKSEFQKHNIKEIKQIELINKLYYRDGKNLGDDSSLDKDVIENFNEGHIVYYYNAWENDNHIDPIKSLIFKIINDYPKEEKQTIDGNVQIPLNFKEFMKSISLNALDLDQVKDYQSLVDNIYTVEEKRTALNNLLNNIIHNNKKIVIIIDELDRCNPKYAIDVIEAIKHFYNNDKIIFLVVSNNTELSYAISNFYGKKFNGYGYLNKIYDLIINLENIDTKLYLNSVLSKSTEDRFTNIMTYSLCRTFSFSMREINRYVYFMEILDNYFTMHDGFRDNYLLKYVFVPYCIALKIKKGEDFNRFIEGKNIDDFIEIMNSDKGIISVVKRTMELNKDSANVECHDYVRKNYNVYFNNSLEEKHFDKMQKKSFMEAISLISDFSNFEQI
jgi:hypothetical protein